MSWSLKRGKLTSRDRNYMGAFCKIPTFSGKRFFHSLPPSLHFFTRSHFLCGKIIKTFSALKTHRNACYAGYRRLHTHASVLTPTIDVSAFSLTCVRAGTLTCREQEGIIVQIFFVCKHNKGDNNRKERMFLLQLSILRSRSDWLLFEYIGGWDKHLQVKIFLRCRALRAVGGGWARTGHRTLLPPLRKCLMLPLFGVSPHTNADTAMIE